MKVLIIDDEQPAIDELAYLLEAYDNITIEATFNSPKRALEFILLNEVDAIFLDIQMPEMDGFALAEVLIRLRKPPKIVFVTAYDEYAIKAFEISAVDYLLKPTTDDRMKNAIDKLSQAMDQQAPIEEIIKDRYLSKRTKRLPLWKDDRIHLISPRDIVYLEYGDGESKIYTTKGIYITTEPLNHYEEILSNYGFFRCHRNFMIGLESVTEVIPWFNNTYQVKMSGYHGAEIPVSRRNVKMFKELLQLK